MDHRVLLALFVGFGLLLPADSASAQFETGSTVSGSARSHFQPKPNKLRMQVELRCYGSTIEAALKNLKTRRDTAAAEIKKLSTDPASICFSVPRAGMPQAMTSTFGAVVAAGPFMTPGPVVYAPPATYAPSLAPNVPIPAEGTPADAPPPVVVSPTPTRKADAKPRPSLFVATTMLKAEWPLEGADADAVIVDAEAIRQKAMSMDLTGAKAAREQLSPEEQEIAEETEMRPPQPANGFAPSLPMTAATSQPVFVYVAVLSAKQRKAMLVDACAAAKEDAVALAEAAGTQLGTIASLNSNFTSSCAARSFGTEYPPSLLTPSVDREAVAASPDGLEFECNVSMSYRILPAKTKQ
jgi:hypothetical protein